jgi:IS4 transposase
MAHYKGTPLCDLLNQMQQLTLRIVNISLEGNEVVSVATNLSESEFSSQEISQLYRVRWGGVETAFDMLKNQ